MNVITAAPAPPSALERNCELELGRLHAENQVYLDYTGAAPYQETLLREHFAILSQKVFGNPHSRNPASLSSMRAAEAARDALLEFLDADARDYEVAWTANASAALRLVGESYPFSAQAPFVLSADNHNTINGIREHARTRGAAVHYLPLDEDLRVSTFQLPRAQDGLFAFPAQSNFSGVRHPLSWVALAQAQGYRVLLDAAAFLPTHRLSLRETGADYVALSFYKIFGYPTGLGALVARRAALRVLQRPAFSGGTVEFVSVLADRYLLKDGPEAFEDGTGNFLAFSAVPLGLRTLERLNMLTVQEHVTQLTDRLLRGMSMLRYAHGAAGIQMYGPGSTLQRGGTVAFNVLDPYGVVIDYERVVDAAAERGICLRGGCFCNPGCAERAFAYTAHELAQALDAVRGDFSMPAMRVALAGKPVGAVRASMGYGSRTRDVDVLLDFLRQFLNDFS